jgi:type IV pilus assembly protein PilQ
MIIKGCEQKRVWLFSLLCLALALSTFAGCAAVGGKDRPYAEGQPASIEDIRVTASEGERTVVEIVNSKSAPYTAFKLIDPPRLVLDIRGVPGKELPRVTQVNDGNVQDIRLEMGKTQAMTSRVVLGLSREGDYTIDEKDNVILLTYVPKAGAAQAVTPSGAGSTDLATVVGVDFRLLDRGKSRLKVTTDRRARYNLERKGPRTLVLVLEDISITPMLMRRLERSYSRGAVERVNPVFSSGEKRLSLDIRLREMVPLHVDQREGDISIDFGAIATGPVQKKIIPVKLVEANKGVPQIAITGQASGGAQMQVIPGMGRKTYRGPNMTMDFNNAEVTNVLRLIGEVSNLNIIWGPEVKGKVSMRLKNVPWEQALELILANNNLGRREEGNIIWVAPKTKIVQIEKEEEQKRRKIEETLKQLEEEKEQAKQKEKEEEPLITEYLRVDFANATEDIMPHVEKIISDRGKISVDERTNTIILTDTEEIIEKAKTIKNEFDTPVKQIMIEARIVDASTNLGRDLGVQWNNIEFQRRKNVGVPFGTPPDPTGFTTGGDRLTGGNFATNALAGWASNIGLSFGYLTSTGLGALALDASLALAESENRAKVISAPKVIASNGEQATISRGSTFYLAAAENVEPKEVNADLSLEVTPTVSFNNFVNMSVTVKDEQETATGKSGKDVSTKLMVKSGETIVIGGIYTENDTEGESGIPWLKDVPVLGWLFNAQSITREKTELLIFLTPTVLPPPGETQ